MVFFNIVIDTAGFKITVLFPKVYQHLPDNMHATSVRVNHITIKEILSCNMLWTYSLNESIGLHSLIMRKLGFDLLQNADSNTRIFVIN